MQLLLLIEWRKARVVTRQVSYSTLWMFVDDSRCGLACTGGGGGGGGRPIRPRPSDSELAEQTSQPGNPKDARWRMAGWTNSHHRHDILIAQFQAVRNQ